MVGSLDVIARYPLRKKLTVSVTLPTINIVLDYLIW